MEFQLPSSAESLLSTYFSISKDDQGKDKLDFTHKSFQEYLLAEFYLESIFNEKYYRLIGKDPSTETYYFMNSFIKLLSDIDPTIRKYSDNFVKSFYKDNGEGNEIGSSNFINRLKHNSFKHVTQKDWIPDIPRKESGIWNFTRLEYGDLDKLWVSRWITVHVAGNLTTSFSIVTTK